MEPTIMLKEYQGKRVLINLGYSKFDPTFVEAFVREISPCGKYCIVESKHIARRWTECKYFNVVSVLN